MFKQTVLLLLVLVVTLAVAQRWQGSNRQNQWNNQDNDQWNNQNTNQWNGQQSSNNGGSDNNQQNSFTFPNRPQQGGRPNRPWGNQPNQNRPWTNNNNNNNNDNNNNNNRPTTRPTSRTTTVTSSTSTSSVGSDSSTTTTAAPAYTACLAACPTANHYNPVCGTDDVTYNSQQRLDCAVRCGANVQLAFQGTCQPL